MSRLHTVRLRVGMSLCVGLLAVAEEPRSFAEATLATIIENVAQNEKLYENIDVQLSERYIDRMPPAQAIGTLIPLVASHNAVHYVGQNGMFRVDVSSTKKSANKEWEWSGTRMFDLATTRLHVANEKHAGRANLVSGRADDEKVVRPHMMLLRDTRKLIPLSVYMRGRAAIEAYPYGQLSPVVDLNVTYKGQEVCDGLNCHIIWLTHTIRKTKTLHSRWALWLAEERNYIPVKREGYVFRVSKTVPVGMGKVTEWSELKPGVWCPFHAEIDVYDEMELETTGNKKLRLKYEYDTERISLEPKYDVSYFKELAIPRGASVYEIKDRKIVGSRRQGGEMPQAGSILRAGWLWGLLGISFLCGVGVVMWRRRPSYHR